MAIKGPDDVKAVIDEMDRLPKRRAWRGHTHDPWPCCGKPPDGSSGRPKDGICRDCQQLIEEGKAARAATAAKKDLVPFHWTERDYGFPGYYSSEYRFPNTGDHHDQLKAAMFNLVNAAATPAPGDTPRLSPNYTMRPSYMNPSKMERDYAAWPMVLTVKTDHNSWSWDKLVLMPEALRNAIDQMDQTVRAVLGAVFQEGKERGSSLLHQLASGEKTLADFEEGIGGKK